MADHVEDMKREVSAAKRTPEPPYTAPTWALALVGGIGAAIIEKGAQIFFQARLWHPYQLLSPSAISENATLLLKTAPFVWPAIGFAALYSVGLMFPSGKKGGRRDITCSLGGFNWDRNTFCRGWLCTGATGSGKCWAPETEVLMFDGTIKQVKDVVVGDLLMGDDSTPRTVLSTTRGQGPLYRISPVDGHGDPWICNDVHMMVLRYSPRNATRPTRTLKQGLLPTGRCAFDPYKDEIFALRSAGYNYRAIGAVMEGRPGIAGVVKSDKMAVLDYIRKRTRNPEPAVRVWESKKTVLKTGVYQAFGVDLVHQTAVARQHFYDEFWTETIDVQLDQFLSRTSQHQLNGDGYGVSRHWKLFRVGVEFNQEANTQARRYSPEWLYIAGLWLGDGDKQCCRFTATDAEVISALYQFAESNDFRLTDEPDGGREHVRRIIISPERIRQSGRFAPSDDKHPYRMHAQCLGDDNGKFIPHWMLTASREHRFALLAGLIDSDGSLSNGCYEITSKYERLAFNIQFLARSLGLYASKHERTVSINSGKYAGFKGVVWSVNISGHLAGVPVRISRKKASARQQKKDPLVFGWKADPIGEGDYCGFTLDGNGRLLLADFTVTHNTQSGVNPVMHQVFMREAGEEKESGRQPA